MGRAYHFGRFRLDTTRHRLLADGQPVALGARALELLLALVEGGPGLRRKGDLLDRVWPGLEVEEHNLPAQVSVLRSVIGAEAIRTVPGLGYRFALELVEHDDEGATAAPALPPAAGRPLRFGALAWWPAERRATWTGQPLALGGRAMALLALLIEQRHRTVSRQELMQGAWPGRVVEPNNVEVQVSRLRRLLGPGAIAAQQGVGYRFTLQPEGEADGAAAPEATRGAGPPPPPDELLGREADLQALADELGQHRLVTIVGPGGIGKTRLAAELAARRRAATPDAAVWADLAVIDTAAKIVPQLAAALALDLGEGEALPQLVRALSRRRLLLVIDNAEHLCRELAVPLQTLLDGAPGLRLLLTSREPLKLAGERLLRLDPLELPEPGMPLAAARGCAAVRLLERRVKALQRRFELNESQLDAAVRLCRQLDGVPLAIEMAAARVPLLGLPALQADLGRRLSLLRQDLATVPQRQRTLHTTFEWSHGLLSAAEQVVLRRLAVFVGSFGLDAACRVAGAAPVSDENDLLDALGGLVDRSMVQIVPAEPPRYRLFETTRLLALQKLDEAGELGATTACHACAMATLADGIEERYWRMADADWLAAHVPDQPDLELAFERACRERDAVIAASTLHALFRLNHLRTLYGPLAEHLRAASVLLDGAEPAARARLQLHLGYYWAGRIEGVDALACAQAASAAFQASGDRTRAHEALVNLACALGQRGLHGAAADAAQASLRLEDPAWPPRRRWLGATMRGLAHAFAGQTEDYRRSAAEQLPLALQAGSPCQAANARLNMADSAAMAGDWAEAVRIGREAVAELRRLELRALLLLALGNLLGAEVRLGEIETARRTALEVLDVAGDGNTAGYHWPHCALLLARLGDQRAAAVVLGQVDRWLASSGRSLEPVEQAVMRDARAHCEAALDPATFGRALQEGAALDEPRAHAAIRAALQRLGG